MNPAGRVLRRLGLGSYLPRNVFTLDGLPALMQAMGWSAQPLVEGEHLDGYQHTSDHNFRRRRDAEAIAAAARNVARGHVLEIGTADGHTTLLLARNAPEAQITTVNLLPEQAAGAGHLVTDLPPRERIGQVWRAAGCANVRQVFANTARWRCDVAPLALAFIDGCHDADFVVNDTELVLAAARPGTLILWHDFAPSLRAQFDWVDAVCTGIDRLYRRRRLAGPIFHPANSLVGIYKVP
jgi:predicted O-methyltransferase YrrM